MIHNFLVSMKLSEFDGGSWNNLNDEDKLWNSIPQNYPESFNEINKWISSLDGLLYYYSTLCMKEKKIGFIHYYIFSINHAIDYLLQKINDNDLPTFIDRHKSYLGILNEKKANLLNLVGADYNPIEVNQLDELSTKLKKVLKDNYERPKISQTATRIDNELSKPKNNNKESKSLLFRTCFKPGLYEEFLQILRDNKFGELVDGKIRFTPPSGGNNTPEKYLAVMNQILWDRGWYGHKINPTDFHRIVKSYFLPLKGTNPPAMKTLSKNIKEYNEGIGKPQFAKFKEVYNDFHFIPNKNI